MSSQKGTPHPDQIKRLNRIAGQIKGIIRMVEEERYCIEIVTQLKAVKSALASVERKIVDEHLNHCVHKALSSKNSARTNQMLSEIKELLKTTHL